MPPAATEGTPLISKSDVANDAAKFREFQQRWFMRCKTNSWIALLLCCFSQSMLAVQGMGWQTLQQNMIDEGCPYSKIQLDEISNWSSGLGFAAYLPMGLLFDYYGPLAVGAGGVFFGGVGLCGVAASLMFPDYLYWLLGPSSMFIVVCCSSNKFSLYGYLWILHEHRFTVTAVFQVKDALAQTGALLSVWLTNSYGVTTGAFFMGLGLLCCAYSIILWLSLPVKWEATLLKKYTSSMMACKGEEKPSIDDIFGAKQDEDKQNQTMFEKLSDVVYIACRQHPGDVWTFMANRFSMHMACVTLYINLYAYYSSMFSEETSLSLVIVFPSIYRFVGPFFALTVGTLFDKIGMGRAMIVGNGACIVYLILNAIPSKGSIIGAMVVYVGAFSYGPIIGSLFSQLYSPPELLGTYMGCFLSLVGIGQIFFAGALDAITLVIFSEHSYWKFGTQFLIWGVAVLLTSSLMLYRFNFINPVKKPGVSSYAELRQHQSWGATREPVVDNSAC